MVCGLLADSSQPAPVVQGLSMTGWGNVCFCGLVYLLALSLLTVNICERVIFIQTW